MFMTLWDQRSCRRGFVLLWGIPKLVLSTPSTHFFNSVDESGEGPKQRHLCRVHSLYVVRESRSYVSESPKQSDHTRHAMGLCGGDGLLFPSPCARYHESINRATARMYIRIGRGMEVEE